MTSLADTGLGRCAARGHSWARCARMAVILAGWRRCRRSRWNGASRSTSAKSSRMRSTSSGTSCATAAGRHARRRAKRDARPLRARVKIRAEHCGRSDGRRPSAAVDLRTGSGDHARQAACHCRTSCGRTCSGRRRCPSRPSRRSPEPRPSDAGSARCSPVALAAPLRVEASADLPAPAHRCARSLRPRSQVDAAHRPRPPCRRAPGCRPLRPAQR